MIQVFVPRQQERVSADRHLTVRKEVTGNATETKVRQMEGPERLQELAEMIGGQRITDTTRAQAQELLDAARGEFSGVSPGGTAGVDVRPHPQPTAESTPKPGANGKAARNGKPDHAPKSTRRGP